MNRLLLVALVTFPLLRSSPIQAQEREDCGYPCDGLTGERLRILTVDSTLVFGRFSRLGDRAVVVTRGRNEIRIDRFAIERIWRAEGDQRLVGQISGAVMGGVAGLVWKGRYVENSPPPDAYAVIGGAILGGLFGRWFGSKVPRWVPFELHTVWRYGGWPDQTYPVQTSRSLTSDCY